MKTNPNCTAILFCTLPTTSSHSCHQAFSKSVQKKEASKICYYYLYLARFWRMPAHCQPTTWFDRNRPVSSWDILILMESCKGISFIPTTKQQRAWKRVITSSQLSGVIFISVFHFADHRNRCGLSITYIFLKGYIFKMIWATCICNSSVSTKKVQDSPSRLG